MTASAPNAEPSICVVGSGTRFLSGISYHTWRLASALGARTDVSVVLMRRLLPRALYPGRARVGATLSNIRYPEDIPVYDGVDWYWIPSIWRAIRFLHRRRPDALVLEWWSGTVLHSYLALALVARLMGTHVIIEFHEVLDTAEARLPVIGRYVRLMARALTRISSAYAVHSAFDQPALADAYRVGHKPVAVVPVGSYDHHVGRDARRAAPGEAPAGVCNLLFFGTIRPYKGLEDLVEAFSGLSDEEAQAYWLTIVGETWEGWTRPAELVASSPHRTRITFVNRYVTDDEVDAWFAGADVAVLPYHRSSASGPLHVTMSQGMPVIVTAVGGLEEAAIDYSGAVFVPPAAPEAIRAALPRARALADRTHRDPHSWGRSADELLALVRRVVG